MIKFLNSIALTSCLILSATTIMVNDSAIARPKIRCLIRGGRWSKRSTLFVFEQGKRDKLIYDTSSKKRRKLEKRGAKQGCKNFSNVFH